MTADDDDLERFQERLKQGRPGSWRARFARVAWIAGAGGLVWLASKGLPWMIDHGRESVAACRVEQHEKHAPASGTCGPSLWYVLPRAFSWTRDDARKAWEASIENDATSDLDWASREVASKVAVEHAASKLQPLLEAEDDEWLTSFDPLASRLANAGAFDRVAKLDPARSGTALAARLWLGDLAGATTAAVAEPVRRSSDHGLRRGALLCLVGRAEEGRAALDAYSKERWDRDAIRARVLCGDKALDAVADKDLRRALLADPAWHAGRRVAIAWSLVEKLGVDAVALGNWIAEDSSATAADLFDTLTDSDGRVYRIAPSHDAIAYVTGDGPFASGERLERAAARVNDLASATGDLNREIAARTFGDAKAPHAREAPDLFRRVSWAMLIEASASYLRVGDRSAAARTALEAIKRAPAGLAYLAARRALSAGEPVAAVRACRDATAEADFAKWDIADRTFVHTTLALALAAQEKWGEAAPAAERAADTTDGMWLSTAFELKIGGAQEKPFEGEPTAEPASLAALARAPESQRSTLRAKVPVSPIEDPFLAPAMVFVMRQLAPPNGDVEVWLAPTTALGDGRPKQLRMKLHAHALAARWAGDAAGAAELERRAASLDALVKDVRTALLAEAAGL